MKKYLFVVISLLIGACESKKGPSKEDFTENLDEISATDVDISDENIVTILNGMPSPMEISFIIHGAGIEYNNQLLNSEDNVSNYNSVNRKAINLGIYGTDLGYTDIYEQNQDGLSYLAVVKELADDLGIGQYFDFNLIRKLTENSGNMDSLILVTNENFNKINQHFQDQNRSSLSSLLLLGGWIESLHLTCQVTLKNLDNQELSERIGEQKIILENMIILLDLYGQQDDFIKDLSQSILGLKEAFDEVEIVYTYEESTSTIVDGVLVIQDNSSSKVLITPDQVTKIAEQTELIRNKIIG